MKLMCLWAAVNNSYFILIALIFDMNIHTVYDVKKESVRIT